MGKLSRIGWRVFSGPRDRDDRKAHPDFEASTARWGGVEPQFIAARPTGFGPELLENPGGGPYGEGERARVRTRETRLGRVFGGPRDRTDRSTPPYSRPSTTP
jgi:hypothetical protein